MGFEPGTLKYLNPSGHTPQIVKLGNLIGYLIRNIFMEKVSRKSVLKTSPITLLNFGK